MGLRLATFLIWALVAGSAVFWGLRWWAPGPSTPGDAAPAATHALLRGDVGRVLGRESPAQPAAVAPASVVAPSDTRYRLLGVMAPRDRGAPEARGLALISIDGAPARAFREGARVEGAQWLLRVEPRRAHLGARGSTQAATLVLELPEPPSSAAVGAQNAAADRALTGPAPRPPALSTLPAWPPGAPAGASSRPAPAAVPSTAPSAAGASVQTPSPTAEPQSDTAGEAGAGAPPVPMRRPGPALR